MYLQVITLRKEPYYRGGQKLEGITCFAEGALTPDQERSITGDGSGVIQVARVDAPPEGAKVIEAPEGRAQVGQTRKGVKVKDN